MITNDDKALLLLCSYLGLREKDVRPLTLKEWNEIAIKIARSSIGRPENLFSMETEELKQKLEISEKQVERIERLLSRSFELSTELERLYNKGVRVITRANMLYPKRLRKKLKDLSPPVIFYCGNLELANEEGIGIVGSRNLKEKHVEFTKELVKKAVDENLVIFSGGARGVDDTSEKEAFNLGGRYASFLADSLESKIKKKDIREKLLTNRVLLMTSTKPDVGFSVGTAMNRNKYIYALSKGTFIIASDYKKGGTWTGAVENLKNKWTETFVRKDMESRGNEELIKLGAIEIDNLKNISVYQLLKKTSQLSEHLDCDEKQIDLGSILETNGKEEGACFNRESNVEKLNGPIEIESEERFDLYYHVIGVINDLVREEKTIEELSDLLNTNKSQLRVWLNRAVEEGKLKKLQRPVRYVYFEKN